MLYYRVKKEYDQKPLFKCKNKRYYPMHFLIVNELYTKKELEKLEQKNVFIPLVAFEKVNINKNSTFFSFGARFSL